MHALDPVSSRALALIGGVICSAVLAFVSVPASCLRECFAAHSALVWLFTSVCEFVLLEARHLSKTFSTALKFACVRSLSRVRAYVVLEVACSRECLDTVGIGTDEGPLSRVHTPVHIQVLGSVEAFATARELTLARPIGDVDLLDVRAQVGWEREGSPTPRVVALVRSVLVPLPLPHLDHTRVHLPSLVGEERIVFQFGCEQGGAPLCLLDVEHTLSVNTLGTAEHLTVHTWGTTFALRG